MDVIARSLKEPMNEPVAQARAPSFAMNVLLSTEWISSGIVWSGELPR